MLSWLDLTTTDPAFNLAAEQFVFDELPRDRMYFMLWQNHNAIIIGKHQNTHAEINEAFVRERDIRVVRRLSGGGAVYHDLGNLNFTFIADAGDMDRLNMRLFCEPVVRALAAIGITAQINGRNDMTIAGKKFSGNSQYVKNGRVMHHGTILFDSDLEVVGQALQVDPEKIRAKGIQSVRSRVTNVSEHLPSPIPLAQFRKHLLEQILAETPGEEYVFSPEEIAKIEALRAARYDTWEWNYGASHACTLRKKARFEGCGTVELLLTLDRGTVTDVRIYGDFFSLNDPEALARLLVGCRHSTDDYGKALSGIRVDDYISGLENHRFLELLEQ